MDASFDTIDEHAPADVQSTLDELRDRIATQTQVIEHLTALADRLATVVEAVPDLILLVRRDGSILWFNRTYPDMAEDDVLGINLIEFIRPEDQDAVQRAIESVLTTGEAAKGEGWARGPFNTRRLFSYRITGVILHGRVQVPVATVVCTDITQLREAEDQAQARLDELAHIDRVNLGGTLSVNFAHELNQPLQAITFYADTSLKIATADEPDMTQLIKGLTNTVRQSVRAGDIVTRMRSFLEKRQCELSPSSVHKIVDDAILICQSRCKRQQVALTRAVPDALPEVLADDVQLVQVLVNFILNAIDAVEGFPSDRRRVTISAATGPADAVTIEVCDRGSGLDDGQLKRLFEPFISSKESGMGMGLAISRRIVEAHRGELSAQNNNDQGCTFAVSIPTA